MQKSNKKVLVSGVQSSGTLHIGNYFGAIKQNIDLANSGDGEQYEPYIFIADYHSMTTLTDSEARRKSVFDTACTYLACGLDVSRSALFAQSSVPAHTELAWILSTVTPMPMLELAHSYKDKIGDGSKRYEINTGLFTYPVLMAADILMYNASIVPVGKDQIQHVEYAREIAGKYNRAYSLSESDFTFTMPEAYIKDDVMIVPGLDGNKMSKSKGNVIPIFASDEEYKKAIAGIVTDSARPEDKKVASENNIYKIHSLFLNDSEREILKGKFENASSENPYGYKQAKDELLETIIRYFSPMRDRYFYYQRNGDEVYKILEDGAARARSVSDVNMELIRKQVGLK